jgi:hypothetical protein
VLERSAGARFANFAVHLSDTFLRTSESRGHRPACFPYRLSIRSP